MGGCFDCSYDLRLLIIRNLHRSHTGGKWHNAAKELVNSCPFCFFFFLFFWWGGGGGRGGEREREQRNGVYERGGGGGGARDRQTEREIEKRGGREGAYRKYRQTDRQREREKGGRHRERQGLRETERLID